MIKVLAGGKKSKNWVFEAQTEYEKRLKKPFDAHFEYVSDEKIAALAANWPAKADWNVILLDERGENISSPMLSQRLETAFLAGKHILIIIGGPYGVPEEIREKADFVWSLSKLVFPHELVRVLLAEQIYRAQEISRGSKYHHV